MILTVTPNPCIDKALFVPRVQLGRMNRAARMTEIAGGKGNNVARVLKALGHEVVALNLLGGQAGHRIMHLLEADEVLPAAVWFEGESREIVTVFDEAGRCPSTEYAEPAPTPGQAAFGEFVSKALDIASEADFVVLSGSVPGAGGDADGYGGYDGDSERELYATLVRGVRALGVPVLLDAHGPALLPGLMAGPDYCKPNDEEARTLFGDDPTPRECLDSLRGLGVAHPLISLGAQGVVALQAGTGYVLRATPPPIDAVNSVGSGDSFVAGLIHGLMVSRRSMRDALAWGTAAGAANARQRKAACVSSHDVLELLPLVKVTADPA